MALEVGFLLEGLQEEFVGTREDPPIDEVRGIPGDVGPVFVEFGGRAALSGAVAAGEVSFHHDAGRELERAQFADILREEEFVALVGGGH